MLLVFVMTVFLDPNHRAGPPEERSSEFLDMKEYCIVPERTNSGLVPYWKRSSVDLCFKVYTGVDDKYSVSTRDDFEQNLMVFLEHYEQADIREDDRLPVLNIMLIDQAWLFYLECLKRGNLSFRELDSPLGKQFVTSKRTRAPLCEWATMMRT